jgi:hypothetical protein
MNKLAHVEPLFPYQRQDSEAVIGITVGLILMASGIAFTAGLGVGLAYHWPSQPVKVLADMGMGMTRKSPTRTNDGLLTMYV